jgi:hypothetical protein
LKEPRQNDLIRLVFQFTIVAVLSVICLSFAWFLLVPADDSDARQLAALDEKRANWESNRPPAYQYIVRRRCFCGTDFVTPYLVVEKNGRRTAEYLGAINSGGSPTGPADPDWLDELFTIARDATKENQHVVMSFDDKYGFPNLVAVGDDCIDCRTSYSITNFKAIEGKSAALQQ